MNAQDDIAKCVNSTYNGGNTSFNYCQRNYGGECVNVTAIPFPMLEAKYDLNSASPSANR